MATRKITGFDSKFRQWQIWRDGDGMILLDPVGHDTDPDGPELSVEDEFALLALAPEMTSDDEDDYASLVYDRARDRLEDERMAA